MQKRLKYIFQTALRCLIMANTSRPPLGTTFSRMVEVIISLLYLNKNVRFAAKHVTNPNYLMISRSVGRQLMEAKGNRACF